MSWPQSVPFVSSAQSVSSLPFLQPSVVVGGVCGSRQSAVAGKS